LKKEEELYEKNIPAIQDQKKENAWILKTLRQSRRAGSSQKKKSQRQEQAGGHLNGE